jgi:hypothetical protein
MIPRKGMIVTMATATLRVLGMSGTEAHDTEPDVHCVNEFDGDSEPYVECVLSGFL